MTKNLIWLGLIGLMLFELGCKQASAQSRKRLWEAQVEEWESLENSRTVADPEVEESGRRKTSIDVAVLETTEEESLLVPGFAPLPESAEPDSGESTPEPSERKLLAVKVRVTNNHENLTIPVSPQRFQLEVGEGKRLLPLASGGQLEPALNPCYLPGGGSVSGWLFFDVQDRKALGEATESSHLLANFRRPNLRISLAGGDQDE